MMENWMYNMDKDEYVYIEDMYGNEDDYEYPTDEPDPCYEPIDYKLNNSSIDSVTIFRYCLDDFNRITNDDTYNRLLNLMIKSKIYYKPECANDWTTWFADDIDTKKIFEVNNDSEKEKNKKERIDKFCQTLEGGYEKLLNTKCYMYNKWYKYYSYDNSGYGISYDTGDTLINIPLLFILLYMNDDEFEFILKIIEDIKFFEDKKNKEG